MVTFPTNVIQSKSKKQKQNNKTKNHQTDKQTNKNILQMCISFVSNFRK